MDIRSKGEIRKIIVKDLLDIHNQYAELSKHLAESLEDNLHYVQELFTELSQPTSGPLVTKTPRVLRKRAVQHIKTIPEDDILQREDTSTSSTQSIIKEDKEINEVANGRLRRKASQRAADNIRKQQSSVMPHMNLKRPLNDDNISDDNISVKKDKRKNQIKRKKSSKSSSDEDDNKKSLKYSKLDENLTKSEESARKISSKRSGQIINEEKSNEEITEKTKESNISSKLRHSIRSRSKVSQNEEAIQTDDAIIAPIMNDIEEPSMYEDAIGKPIPIMNSTVRYSSSVPEKALNVTVVLEPLLQQKKLNETVIIQKTLNQRNSNKMKERMSKKRALKDSTELPREATKDDVTNAYNELITDDESSPEIKESKKQIATKQKKPTILMSSDDEVPNTPVKTHFREMSVATQESKTIYKSNALFSPYAKESVKKRVEAFEQAVMYCPVDIDASTRVTRTKTRAMAAAEVEMEMKNTDKSVAQKLARKSLAKAKKIACLAEKHKKDTEECKENKEHIPERINKLLLNDKLNVKQIPQPIKTTPLSKPRIVLPMSVNHLHTPSNIQNLLNYSKPLTVSRANIVTNVESFIQAPKPTSKIQRQNSVEKLEDKKRHEDDARKKREETLRLQTEERRKKRQEKEMKNKLAKAAKEKQEREKRLKMEKEKEEKAKLVQLMQDKQREEIEKKRLVQLQRAQEKEERRKLEEKQRLQRLQEQEEAERLLAEQRRREQEAEKRKEAEVKAQQQAAEILKQKQMLMAQAKYKQANNKYKGTTNYVLDSEPDDDESDDETRPKHEIPYWALPHVRKTELALQRYFPQEIIYKFFDTRKCTPNLAEMFHGIDRSRLKRTSSAIWKTPPRFSMMGSEYSPR